MTKEELTVIMSETLVRIGGSVNPVNKRIMLEFAEAIEKKMKEER